MRIAVFAEAAHRRSGRRSDDIRLSARADRNSDVASWAKTPESTSLAHPPFVWIGSPSILSNASILPGARRIRTSDGAELDIKLVPKLPANRSYADSATAAYFAGREVRTRGAVEKENGKPLCVARTIWPRDFSLDLTTPPSQPETGTLDLAAFIRQLPGENPGPETYLLWERFPNRARKWTQKTGAKPDI